MIGKAFGAKRTNTLAALKSMPSRTLAILGSTGSIGVSTLDVVRRNRDRFQIFALVAGRNVELLAQQIQEFRPALAVVEETRDLDRLRQLLPNSEIPDLQAGPAGRLAAVRAAEVDTVMSSIVGVAGLEATYEAVCLGKRIGLANKEVLVSAGKIVMAAVQKYGAELIPVDSEHNGAHQCLRAGRREEATRLILTASGGPFRTTPRDALDRVTPAEALKHPTWRMGNRITIDSATLMNKGFEVIEACWLFDFPPDKVEVVVHPQSTVHAMVEYNDGSVIAQVCQTDMRMPIQYALTWPDRASAPVPRMDWSSNRQWTFEPPDEKKFPLLRLAYDSLGSADSATCVLNAADEIAVEAFLSGHISFPGIAGVVEETLNRMPGRGLSTIAEVLEMDLEARRMARNVIDGMARAYENDGSMARA
jgi:1-deoxy-D-xylulose-5-phosphate reductoisomerase